MKLDTATIAAISVLVDFALVFILIHTWRTRTTYPGFAVWIVATVCWPLGSGLNILLNGMEPQFLPKIVGMGLILLHPALLHEGLFLFHGIPRRWWLFPLNVALVLAGLFFQTYFIFVEDNLAARAVASNTILALLFARVALEPLFHPAARRYSMQWLLSLSLIPLIAMLSLRVFMIAAHASPESFTRMLEQETLLRWLMLYGVVLEVLIAYSYLSLTSDRVEENLRGSEESYRSLSASLREKVEEETRRRVSQERLLANSSRLAAMGEMISAIAHQWRQPLATLGMIVQRTHAVGTMQGLTPAMLDEFKASSMRQVRYMSDTIEEFRGFYRPEKQKEPFQPFTCLSDSVRLFEPQFTSNGIAVSVNSGNCGGKLVNGFPNEFKQVVLNLLGNARDAILESRASGGAPEKGLILVEMTEASGASLIIDIGDNGCGISPAITPRIFDPNFTTKQENGGTGIGLYMSRMIVEDSLGGRLSLLKGADGATFRIELPMQKEPS